MKRRDLLAREISQMSWWMSCSSRLNSGNTLTAPDLVLNRFKNDRTDFSPAGPPLPADRASESLSTTASLGTGSPQAALSSSRSAFPGTASTQQCPGLVRSNLPTGWMKARGVGTGNAPRRAKQSTAACKRAIGFLESRKQSGRRTRPACSEVQCCTAFPTSSQQHYNVPTPDLFV